MCGSSTATFRYALWYLLTHDGGRLEPYQWHRAAQDERMRRGVAFCVVFRPLPDAESKETEWLFRNKQAQCSTTRWTT